MIRALLLLIAANLFFFSGASTLDAVSDSPTIKSTNQHTASVARVDVDFNLRSSNDSNKPDNQLSSSGDSLSIYFILASATLAIYPVRKMGRRVKGNEPLL